MVKRVMFTAYVLCFMCLGQAYAKGITIGHLFEGKSPVKVHVSAVTNESGQSQISAEVFKKALEDSLNNRKAMDFDTVSDPAASDIQITAVIKKYQYLNRGPLNPNPGIATMLADAAATATLNYVEMDVSYTITDAKNNKVLWVDDVKEYIKKTMTPEESIPLIYDKVTRTFLSQCFGEAHKEPVVKDAM
ncbi:MAG: hypothetical protein NTY76_05000 [Candidatus Omnitrophica bacterium]|nr:hypothetical protein [Candidatus Omnitrophota bacterium]